MTTPHLPQVAGRIDWLEARTAIAETLALLITVAGLALPALIAVSQALSTAWVSVLGLTPTSPTPEAPQAAPEAPEPLKPAIPTPQPFGPVLGDLSALRVSELRKLARQQGLSHLGRQGRKADLLGALAA